MPKKPMYLPDHREEYAGRKIKMGAENKITISDLGLASLLVTIQFNLVGLERADEKRIHFVFERAKSIEETIEAYWQDKELKVPIRTLFSNQKMLKDRLYAEK